MNFVAIDFETANEKRNSPCSIGIVVVKDGEIVEKVHYLIKPKEMRFMPINIGIHGIRPRMVQDELEFDKIWGKIKHYFNNNLVTAHNASFDISVLRNTLKLYNIKMPSFDYICTMKLSKNFYSNIDNVRLNTVNNFLGYKFKHHDALADAMACSNILLNISKELNSKNINEISKLVGVTLGYVNENGYKPSSTKGRILKRSNRQASKENKKIIENFNFTAFKEEVVVFTGRLASMTRDEAIILVRKLNGTVGSSVTKRTTYLVTNTNDIEDLNREEMSNKLKKATDLRKKGQNIKFLNEEAFLQKCKEK
ncbi:DNA polymerase III subunit epsilon [Clostridium botulinum A2B7 92]|uniref:DNA polymerase III subunit epsilon n=1 Tax=Clostridium botulinum TaxID=1491 RepID=A0A846J2D8_CLOBO|nr:exonuclease domain-containing protein [Clostridium botulinum]ACA54300.1 exonuclease, DNA polymerase III, epsilon subunit family [Clostridium botulinum A3 str. Loch Maree]KEJ04234.1 DNA polymerase III subunit epsilon [Clostridium botulinum A2B7 92]NFH64482.1 DNA polymerase III subunit epsilon [Clostridium botulinum]NFJ08216.1 DNA polymerase III subunit epsilon [Clostridium botulinum]NFK15982.1 DNA polymerase III subunit epsilon [Clostridium botulinum]